MSMQSFSPFALTRQEVCVIFSVFSVPEAAVAIKILSLADPYGLFHPTGAGPLDGVVVKLFPTLQ